MFCSLECEQKFLVFRVKGSAANANKNWEPKVTHGIAARDPLEIGLGLPGHFRPLRVSADSQKHA